jgi:hypothetical protein
MFHPEIVLIPHTRLAEEESSFSPALRMGGRLAELFFQNVESNVTVCLRSCSPGLASFP